MSDTQGNTIDPGATNPVASTPVAPPPGGESPASTPATTSADTAVPGGPSEDQPQAEPKRDRKVEKRISRLTQKLDSAHQEIGYWRGIAEAKASTPAEPTGDGAQPTRQQQPSPQDLAAQRRAQDVNTQVLARLKEGAKEIEDFDEVMETITDRSFPINGTIRDYLAIADHPAQMAQWMAENPEEVARIANLSDAVATRALEKQDAKLAKPAASKKTTQAPPPVPTVGGRSTAEFDPEKASMDEYAAHWKARQAKG